MEQFTRSRKVEHGSTCPSGALKTPLRVRLWTVQESPVLANQSASRLEA